ncbi:serine hydrolase domain-containing protein [Aurantiacibacter poecillastricola]|uniref:serine hydrolase domain-containing protein n=1 Tax=Aurantiacibacter poecillastricola TaxID=3064385 RepID=UPI00273F45F3|nr:serine hydrolase domain-containing protein [Aurantiacibacter sp. 219JJ12-13]MDP5261520.1 serine hydrolase domain-containing protein [Aurantiacibacter sp. 219JJ12-13]
MQQPIFADFLSRRAVLRGSAVLGAGAAASTLPFTAPAFAQESSRWPGVRQFVNGYVNRDRVACMVAGLGWQQNDPEFIAAGSRTFGGSGEVGPDTIFRIYSMTKPITGLATVMCIDEGLLALDQPLADILPAFSDMQVQRQYDGPITRDNLVPAERPITIRHLLTHTSGLGYSIIQQGPISAAYRANGVVPGQISNLAIAQEFFGGRPASSLAEFADALAELPLVYQPGTRWSYSVGLDLLGRVIEVVTGQAFDSFLEQRIFEPCGMTSTGFRVQREDVGRFTGNYFLMGGIPLPVDLPSSSVYLDEPAFPFGGAGLVSTSRDYDRFLQMLAGRGEIEGTRVASEAAVRLATSNLFPETLASDGAFTSNGRTFGFGAGGLVGQGETEGLFGWFGAAGTVGLVNLEWGLRHNLMTQYMPAEAYGVQADFPQVVAQDAARLLEA